MKWCITCFNTVNLYNWKSLRLVKEILEHLRKTFVMPEISIVPEMTYNVSSGTLSLYTTTA